MADDALFKQKAPGIMDRLIADFRLADFQAAGILGNLGHECAGFHVMQERNPVSGRGGWGWAQWTGPRRRKFEAWCDDEGLQRDSDEANYGYLRLELKTTESGAIASLRKAPTLDAAVEAFERNFERAGAPHYESRKQWARKALEAFRAR